MSGLGLLLRILAVLFVVRLAVRFVANVLVGLKPEAAPELVRDRVCNTFLPRERALTVVVDGHEEHFCSTACRDRARALLPT
jgi:hypothetical protein